MDFASIRVITHDVERLVAFYEQATAVTARWSTPDFAEIVTPSCVLAIASSRTLALFDTGTRSSSSSETDTDTSTGIARPAANQSVIIEFRVADTDAEHRRLSSLGHAFVQEPTTMPWGNRSLLFRDPDGNLVNFFTPVTADALSRLDR
jgi:predicted enzyme related to lactoylglutathione lyase